MYRLPRLLWRKWVSFLEELEEEIKKRKLDKKKILRVVQLVLVLCLVLGAVGWMQLVRGKVYKGYEILAGVPLYSNLLGYRQGNQELILISNDGAKAVGNKGDVAWEVSYQLDNPEVAYCGEMTAVADIGGKQVFVVAENGIPYQYEAMYPIVKHEVATQGVTAVLLDNGLEDFIQLYDINGTLRVDINTKTKIDGIPIDIALSPDGKKLVTLYVTFQGDSMVCKVTFYNADEVGKNYINNIVGQKIYDDNLLAYDICFLNQDTLLVLLENGFAMYRMTEVPELICENRLEEEIIEVVCVEEGLYIVKEDAMKQRSLTFYDPQGKEKQTWNEIPEYEKITATKEEVVFFSPQSVTVYRVNGTLKFSQSFNQSLEAVYPAGGDKYFLVDIGQVQTIKLSDSTNH